MTELCFENDFLEPALTSPSVLLSPFVPLLYCLCSPMTSPAAVIQSEPSNMASFLVLLFAGERLQKLKVKVLLMSFISIVLLWDWVVVRKCFGLIHDAFNWHQFLAPAVVSWALLRVLSISAIGVTMPPPRGSLVVLMLTSHFHKSLKNKLWKSLDLALALFLRHWLIIFSYMLNKGIRE